MSNTPLDTLHMLALPTPWAVGDVNVYLGEGDILTLVDTGPRWDPAREALGEGLDALGYAVSDIKRLIITHDHPDHFGLAQEIVAGSGAEVWAHKYSVMRLTDPAASRNHMTTFFANLYQESGVPVEVAAEIHAQAHGSDRFAAAVEITRLIDDGDRLKMAGLQWQALHTPGHAGGMVCFYQPEHRLLLSSDHLIGEISSNPLTAPPDRPGQKRPRRLVEYMQQLERVAELDVTVALPGHGQPIPDHRGLVQDRLDFHRKRADKILAVLDGDEKTLYELTLPLFPNLRGLDMFLALSEVLGHVDLLEKEARIERVERDAMTYWRRTTS
jgi:glyoxylase-like metal-dependent hydrolase (beta-lactamase superfamily II)